jgi:hypothetical protein
MRIAAQRIAVGVVVVVWLFMRNSNGSKRAAHAGTVWFLFLITHFVPLLPSSTAARVTRRRHLYNNMITGPLPKEWSAMDNVVCV